MNAWLEKGTPAHSYHKKKNPYYLIQEKPVSVQEFFLHQNPGVTAFFLIRFRQIQNTLLNIFWLQNHVLIVLNWKVYDLDQKYSQIFSFLAFSDENDQKWPPKYHNSSIMTYSKGNLTQVIQPRFHNINPDLYPKFQDETYFGICRNWVWSWRGGSWKWFCFGI